METNCHVMQGLGRGAEGLGLGLGFSSVIDEQGCQSMSAAHSLKKLDSLPPASTTLQPPKHGPPNPSSSHSLTISPTMLFLVPLQEALRSTYAFARTSNCTAFKVFDSKHLSF